MSDSGQEHAWERQAYGWFVVWGAVTVLVLVLLLVTNDPTVHRPLAVGALIALGVAYAAVGARSVLLDGEASNRGVLAAALTILCVGVGVAGAAEFSIILFAVYPHLFVWLAPIRRAVLAVVALSVVVAVAQLLNQGFSWPNVAVSALSSTVSMIFALVIGSGSTGSSSRAPYARR